VKPKSSLHMGPVSPKEQPMIPGEGKLQWPEQGGNKVGISLHLGHVSFAKFH